MLSQAKLHGLWTSVLCRGQPPKISSKRKRVQPLRNQNARRCRAKEWLGCQRRIHHSAQTLPGTREYEKLPSMPSKGSRLLGPEERENRRSQIARIVGLQLRDQ